MIRRHGLAARLRMAVVAVAMAMVVGCAGDGVSLPTFELPSFDTAEIQRLVDDALVEVERLADSALELPPDLARLLDENDIRLPALPSNASDICGALGTPGVSTVASAGMSELIGSLVAGGEVGLVVGLLVAVVFRTCPIWMPHLESAVEQLLR